VATLSCTFFCCTDLYKVGRRQNAFLSSWVGYFSMAFARFNIPASERFEASA